jgi:biotin carboxylase
MELAGLVGGFCDIVWVADLADPSLGPMARLIGRLGTVVDVAGRPDADLVADLAALDVDGIVAFTDTQLTRANTLATALGLACNPPETVARLNDKQLQRETLAEAGIAGPASRRLPAGTDAAKAAELADGLTYPVVVKPIRGDSSRDVVAVADPGALVALFERWAETPREPEDFVVEEYLVDRPGGGGAGLGSYVSVELVAQRGEAVPLAITGKFPLAEPFRETGNFMPHLLEADEAQQVLELAVAAAEALDVRSGAMHIEIKLTPAGPRVIEVNGRVGGGAIDAIYARRHGVSLTELATRVALGDDVVLEPVGAAPSAGPFSYECFVQAPTWATRLVAVPNADRVVGVAGATSVAVNRSPGDALDWRAGSQGFILRVSGEADDAATLRTVPEAVLEAITIEYS